MFRKPQYQLLIVGLDFAGKTVLFNIILILEVVRVSENVIRFQSIYFDSCSITHPRSIFHTQTYLEQVKHLYAGGRPVDESKIPPTVGLNCEYHLILNI